MYFTTQKGGKSNTKLGLGIRNYGRTLRDGCFDLPGVLVVGFM